MSRPTISSARTRRATSRRRAIKQHSRRPSGTSCGSTASAGKADEVLKAINTWHFHRHAAHRQSPASTRRPHCICTREMLRASAASRTACTSCSSRASSRHAASYQGQEAVAVGACQALAKTDGSPRRTGPHGHALAKGVSAAARWLSSTARHDRLLCRQGRFHASRRPRRRHGPGDRDRRRWHQRRVGDGLAFKMGRTGQVALCFFGEGASNEGAFHEGLTSLRCRSSRSSTCARTTSTRCRRRSTGRVWYRTSPTAWPDTACRRSSSTHGRRRRQETRSASARAGAAWRGPDAHRGEDVPLRGHSRGASWLPERGREAEWKVKDAIDRLALSITSTGLATDDDLAAVLAEINAE